MDYSYRNNRYRRKKTRQFRRFVAIVIVSLTAGTLVAGYGLINLFSQKKNPQTEEKKVVENTNHQNETEQDVSDIRVISDIKEIEEETGQKNIEPKENEQEGTEPKETTTEQEGGNVIAKKGSPTSGKELIFSKKEAEKYYKDTAFIGDSRTQGLQINAGIRTPKFFAGRGLNVKNAMTDKVVQEKNNKKFTVVEALEGKSFKKIYISFGINELGWTYPDIFIKRYKELIAAVKEKQKDAEIVVYGILPVTKEKSDKDKIFNMKNVKKFNKLIKKMAREIEVTYADLSPAVKNKKGFLPEEVTPDGIHMNKEYCRRILAYIVEKEI